MIPSFIASEEIPLSMNSKGVIPQLISFSFPCVADANGATMRVVGEFISVYIHWFHKLTGNLDHITVNIISSIDTNKAIAEYGSTDTENSRRFPTEVFCTQTDHTLVFRQA